MIGVSSVSIPASSVSVSSGNRSSLQISDTTAQIHLSGAEILKLQDFKHHLCNPRQF